MDALLQIIIILASVLLVLVVFVQNPKGGGLSSDFGAAQQIGGVQKTNDFVEKATWTLASVIALCSIVLTIRMTPDTPKIDPNAEQQTQQQPGQNGAAAGNATGGQEQP